MWMYKVCRKNPGEKNYTVVSRNHETRKDAIKVAQQFAFANKWPRFFVKRYSEKEY